MRPTPQQDEVPLAPSNVHCLVFQKERECLIAGCADGAVRLHFLDGRVPIHNDVALPTVLTGERGVIGPRCWHTTGLLAIARSTLATRGAARRPNATAVCGGGRAQLHQAVKNKASSKLADEIKALH
jgi:hypothetical protein